jgi:hypothetical protein
MTPQRVPSTVDAESATETTSNVVQTAEAVTRLDIGKATERPEKPSALRMSPFVA